MQKCRKIRARITPENSTVCDINFSLTNTPYVGKIVRRGEMSKAGRRECNLT